MVISLTILVHVFWDIELNLHFGIHKYAHIHYQDNLLYVRDGILKSLYVALYIICSW